MSKTIGEKQDIVLRGFEKAMAGQGNPTVSDIIEKSRKKKIELDKKKTDLAAKGILATGLTVIEQEQIDSDIAKRKAFVMDSNPIKHSLLEQLKEMVPSDYEFESHRQLKKEYKDKLVFDFMLEDNKLLTITADKVTSSNIIFILAISYDKLYYRAAIESDKEYNEEITVSVQDTKRIEEKTKFKVRINNGKFRKNLLKEFDKLISIYRIPNEINVETEEIW